MAHTLRTLTIRELLDQTFLCYRHNFAMFVAIVALPNLLLLALNLSMVLVKPGADTAVPALGWAIFVITVVITTVTHSATIIAVSQIQLGTPTNVRDAFMRIRSRLVDLVIVMLHMGLRIGLGFLLLVVPGVFLMLKYALAIPVAVLEQKGALGSMKRSGELTKGHRWRILIIFALLFVLMMMVFMLAELPLVIVAAFLISEVGADQLPWVRAASDVSHFIAQSVFEPVLSIALVLVYFDERFRKEAIAVGHTTREIDVN